MYQQFGVPEKIEDVDVSGTKRFSNVAQCKLIQLPTVNDLKGNLTFVEGYRHIPFDIKRIYYLYDVPGERSRGVHAHRELHQLIIAASGSFEILVHDGFKGRKFHLSRSYYGLYVPPMIWRELDNFSSGAMCLVLASEYYDRSDYIEDFDTFKDIVRKDEARQSGGGSAAHNKK